MKKYCDAVLFALALLLGSGAFNALHADACPPRPPELNVKELAASARDHGFLWRISKNGRVSYLYGTIHSARPEWLFPGPAVSEAIRGSDTMALELDLLDENMAAELQGITENMPAHVLPEALKTHLEQQFRSVCIPYALIEKIAPELQISLLQMELARYGGAHPEFAVDLFLAGIGRGAGLKMVSLETPQQQLQALQSPTPQDSATLVERTLEEIKSGRAEKVLDRLFKAWSESDHDDFSRYAEWCHCRETAVERQLEARLLDGRNHHLADRIDALHMDNHQVFAAVGSLHLFGEAGLPLLMARKGYQVEPLLGKP